MHELMTEYFLCCQKKFYQHHLELLLCVWKFSANKNFQYGIDPLEDSLKIMAVKTFPFSVV
jgi:hypothetical protein